MSQQEPLQATYSPQEVAERYSVDVDRVRGWCRSGRLQGINISDSPNRQRWRISREALEQFELDRTAKPKAPPTAPRRRKQPSNVIQFFE